MKNKQMKAVARLLHTRHSPTGHTPQAEGVEGLQGEERERANQRAGIVPMGCTGDGLEPSRPSRGDQAEGNIAYYNSQSFRSITSSRSIDLDFNQNFF
ncbi:hypothetical protein OUZ56_009438 [Daphnia magna]|uniref:Uncharacterized protein n=1 Tax=Daphnia magna TaxID=35525 RepID=A0ABR0AFZ8_9CRUS|nr:hypothetical protein OUZ56_009438 [Daphnia magna]